MENKVMCLQIEYKKEILPLIHESKDRLNPLLVCALSMISQ